MGKIESTSVAVASGIGRYPDTPPFHPDQAFPESPFPGAVSDLPNPVYTGVRETLRLLGLDREHDGTPEWNPLGDVVAPGDRVVLKPNLVRHWNGAEPHIDALVTHGSVVRALLDYVLIALKNEGEVTVGDAPVQETDFDAVVAQNGLREAIDFVAERSLGVRVTLVDFRKERAHMIPGGVVLSREALPGDPKGYIEVDLGRQSFLAPLSADSGRFRVTNYDKGTMPSAHDHDHNRYLIARSVLGADAVINIPKMKTHGKAGITCTLKNNVGINGHKDWLPHHREGSAARGGDEYQHKSLRKELVSALADRADRAGSRVAKRFLYYATQALRRSTRLVPFKDDFVEGAWHGNDTVWRMVLDLNRVLFFSDREGRLTDTMQRKYLGFVDGVIAGEGDGPLHPTSKAAGVLVAGFNPVAIDVVCARLMGFDESRIPLLANAFDPAAPALFDGRCEDVRIVSNEPRWRNLFTLPRAESLAFVPPSGWRGNAELA